MQTNLRKRHLLLTVALVLAIGVLAVAAYTTLTANTGTITVHQPQSFVVITNAYLAWGTDPVPCAVNDKGRTVQCPGADIGFGNSVMFSVTLVNEGSGDATLNGINFQTNSGNNNVLALHDQTPQTCNESGCVSVPLPTTLHPNQPANLNWQIDTVGWGQDSATFTFNTNG